ncbi:hypothetical protein AB4P95_09885 [Pseudomonas sp. A1437]|uniref:hypothetical protein n=1 Tax=unclassified Pseudomonas TaxID=196821 RepID=UPI003783EC8B
MSAEHDEPRLQLKNALDKLDLKKAFDALKQLESSALKAVLAGKMAQPGAFQLRADRAKRNKFYDSLLNDPAMDQHPAAQSYALDLNGKIKIIEQCFDDIRASLPQCAISKYPQDIQFWSQVERAAGELKELDAAGMKAINALKAKVKARQRFVMPEMTMVKLENGIEVNLDIAYSNIVNMLSLTLKMLSFEYKMLVDGKVVAPVKPEISTDHTFKAGSIQFYAMSWNTLEDIGARTLFFGGQIGEMEALGIPRESLPSHVYKKFPNPIFFQREPADEEAYDFLANRRQHSWGVQNTIQLMQGTKLRNAVVAKGAKAPELTGGGFVSEDEGVTLTTLTEILSFDVFSDQDRHHGLTLREWVRGYCALKLMAKAKRMKSGSSLISFDKAELEQGFIDYRVPESCVLELIDHLTFGTNSRDLYDSPLIRSQNDQYALLAEVLITCNLPNVILSRLGSLDTQIDKKGKGFEDKTVMFLQGLNYQCKPTKFTIDGAQYEYDALLLIDDTLFLIECKNNLLSGNHAVQALRYGKFISDTVKQVKRLEQGLRARPEIVENLFGRKLEELNLVPMILNSLPYSRKPIDGVYISDYSAFSKFLTESTISEFHWKNGKKKVRKVIHRLWSGNRPTAQELLDYLALPIQLKLIIDHLTYQIHPRFTSESTIFFSAVLDVNETAMQQAKQDAPRVD